GRQGDLGVVVVAEGQAELLEVVGALHPRGGVADLLDGGEEQADEDGDDRYHHQQLDQCEGLAPARSDHDGTSEEGVDKWERWVRSYARPRRAVNREAPFFMAISQPSRRPRLLFVK